MKRLFTSALLSLLVCTFALATQNTDSGNMAKTRTKKSASAANSNTTAKKRGPVFRANKDQVKQAQALLKQRSFYTGEQTGKLDDATREGLKKYQTAESIKVTGTLNRLTLEKMSITLTDKQKAM
ncbi:MAG: peptidoglycan-binding domain-containing protein [Pyrinomonadaceae bacterium]